jgi:L-2-hydroxycarboxylate dehydrogenase (NAD+)
VAICVIKRRDFKSSVGRLLAPFALYRRNKKTNADFLRHCLKRVWMAEGAGEEHGIAIVFGSNHNDAGSYGTYAWLAHEQDCVAQTSNNSVPMCSPLGGMGNTIAVPPLDAIGPSGEESPVWMSTKLCEWYDADTAQALLRGIKLKGDFVINPETGERSNDLAPFASPVEGYGRVYDQTCFQNLSGPRVYQRAFYT